MTFADVDPGSPNRHLSIHPAHSRRDNDDQVLAVGPHELPVKATERECIVGVRRPLGFRAGCGASPAPSLYRIMRQVRTG